VGIRAGLDAVAKRIYHCPCRETNPDRLARSLVTILTELSRLTVIDGRELKITEYGLIYSSMIFIPSFTKIHHLVQKLLRKIATPIHGHGDTKPILSYKRSEVCYKASSPYKEQTSRVLSVCYTFPECVYTSWIHRLD
jgi:hypothetical protein